MALIYNSYSQPSYVNEKLRFKIQTAASLFVSLSLSFSLFIFRLIIEYQFKSIRDSKTFIVAIGRPEIYKFKSAKRTEMALKMRLMRAIFDRLSGSDCCYLPQSNPRREGIIFSLSPKRGSRFFAALVERRKEFYLLIFWLCCWFLVSFSLISLLVFLLVSSCFHLLWLLPRISFVPSLCKFQGLSIIKGNISKAIVSHDASRRLSNFWWLAGDVGYLRLWLFSCLAGWSLFCIFSFFVFEKKKKKRFMDSWNPNLWYHKFFQVRLPVES